VADAVQTFRAISWLIFKWLMISVATVIALTAVGIGIYFAYQWFAYDRHVAKIETMINTAESLCDTTDHPLFVGFVNRSSRTISKVSFVIQARVSSHSTNIAQYDSRSSDDIMQPNEGMGHCWTLPTFSEPVKDFRTLNWSLLSVTYIFEDSP